MAQSIKTMAISFRYRNKKLLIIFLLNNYKLTEDSIDLTKIFSEHLQALNL